MNTAEITAYYTDVNVTTTNERMSAPSKFIHGKNTTLLSFSIRQITIFFNSLHNLFITSNSVPKNS